MADFITRNIVETDFSRSEAASRRFAASQAALARQFQVSGLRVPQFQVPNLGGLQRQLSQFSATTPSGLFVPGAAFGRESTRGLIDPEQQRAADALRRAQLAGAEEIRELSRSANLTGGTLDRLRAAVVTAETSGAPSALVRARTELRNAARGTFISANASQAELTRFIDPDLQGRVTPERLASINESIQANRRQAIAGTELAVQEEAAAALQRRINAIKVRNATLSGEAGRTLARAEAEGALARRNYNRELRQAARQVARENNLGFLARRRLIADTVQGQGQGGGAVGALPGGRGINSFFRFALPISLGFAGARLIGDFVREAEELEVIFTRINSQFEFLAAELPQSFNVAQVSEFREELLRIARATGTAPEDLANIASSFLGAFADQGPAAAAQASEIAAQISVLTDLAPGEIFNDLVASAKSFSESEGQDLVGTLSTIGDELIAFRNLTGVAGQELVDFVGRVGPIAAQSGAGLRDVVAIGATLLQQSGVGGAGLAEQFGRILSTFRDSAGEALAELSITSPDIELDLGAIERGDAITTLRELAEQFDNLSESQRRQVLAEIGSRREGATIAALLNNRRTLIRLLNSELDSSGTLQEEFNDRQETLSFQLAQTRAAFEELGIDLFEAGLADFFVTLANAAENLADVLGSTLVPILEILGGAFRNIDDGLGSVGLGFDTFLTGALAFGGARGLTRLFGRFGGGAAVGAGQIAGQGTLNFAGQGAAAAFGARALTAGRAVGSALLGPAGVTVAAFATRTLYQNLRDGLLESSRQQAETELAGVAEEVGQFAGTRLAEVIAEFPQVAAGAINTELPTASASEILQLGLGGSLGDFGTLLRESFEGIGGLLGIGNGAEFFDDPQAIARRDVFQDILQNNPAFQGSVQALNEILANAPQLAQDALLGELSFDPSRESPLLIDQIDIPENLGGGTIDVEAFREQLLLFQVSGFETFSGEQAAEFARNVQLVTGGIEEFDGEAADQISAYGELVGFTLEAFNALGVPLGDTVAEAERIATNIEDADDLVQRASTLRQRLQVGLISEEAFVRSAEGLVEALRVIGQSLLQSPLTEATGLEILAEALRIEENVTSTLDQQVRDRTDRLLRSFDVEDRLAGITGQDSSEAEVRRIRDQIDRLVEDEADPAEIFDRYLQLFDAQQSGLEKALEDSEGAVTALSQFFATIPEEDRVGFIAAAIQSGNEAFGQFLNTYIAAGVAIPDALIDQIAGLIAAGVSAAEALRAAIAAKIVGLSVQLAQINASAGPVAAFAAGAVSAEIDSLSEFLGDLPSNADIPEFGFQTPTAITPSAGFDPTGGGGSTEDLVNDILDARFELLEALNAGDPVELARIAQQRAASQAQRAENEADAIRAQAAAIRADRQLETAIREIADAQVELLLAYADVAGDSVESAQIGLEQARVNVDRAKADFETGQGSEADLIRSQAELTRAQGRLRDEQLSDQLDTIDFQLEIGDITTQQAIQQLETLLASAEQLGLNEEQQRDLELRILRLREELGGDLQFNLPDFLLPTAFEARRLAQGQFSASQGQNLTTNNISIVVNEGADVSSIFDAIGQAIGGFPGNTFGSSNFRP